MESGDEYLAQVTHNGTVTWIPQVIMETTCPITIKMFPRDLHTCTIKVNEKSFSLDNKTPGAVSMQIGGQYSKKLQYGL